MVLLCVKDASNDRCPVCRKEALVAEIIESVDKIELAEPRLDVVIFNARKTCRSCFVERMAEYFGEQFDESVHALKQVAETDA